MVNKCKKGFVKKNGKCVKKSSNKRFVGNVKLYSKGKVYGATTRQVNAKNKTEARKLLKKKFKFKDNKVTVSKIIQR